MIGQISTTFLKNMIANKRIIVTGGSGFIGTNFLDFLITKTNCKVVNFDTAAPRNNDHRFLWREIDINNLEILEKAIHDFKPHCIFNFAARTDLHGNHIGEYQTNILGIKNLIQVVLSMNKEPDIFFFSSMLVNKLGENHIKHDDCHPKTFYGCSKLLGEKIILESKLKKKIIIRPTSIWGPWFGAPYRNFFDILKRGYFISCNKFNVRKTYGYVENSVLQIIYLYLNKDHLEESIFYLGDSNSYLLEDWLKDISKLQNIKIFRFPSKLILLLSLIGSFASAFRLRPPLTYFRYKNMSTQNICPLGSLIKYTGPAKYSRYYGCRKTLSWLEKN